MCWAKHHLILHSDISGVPHWDCQIRIPDTQSFQSLLTLTLITEVKVKSIYQTVLLVLSVRWRGQSVWGWGHRSVTRRWSLERHWYCFSLVCCVLIVTGHGIKWNRGSHTNCYSIDTMPHIHCLNVSVSMGGRSWVDIRHFKDLRMLA